jgi:DNA-binding MarR family transcriptional regulator
MSDEARFDELIHAPQRLRICSLLAATAAVEFATIRDVVQLSDSALSKHLAALEGAGYVRPRRELSASRRRVWVGFTPLGRRAYQAHVRALRQLIEAGPTQ